jgi:hypothetical protein
MEYVFLLIDDESAWTALTEEQQLAAMQSYQALSAKLAAAGALKGGNALQLSSTATTLRSTDGTDRIVSDGPYAEATEYVGGYYEVEVADLDEALHWARQLPMLPGSKVEIRPVMPVDGQA